MLIRLAADKARSGMNVSGGRVSRRSLTSIGASAAAVFIILVTGCLSATLAAQEASRANPHPPFVINIPLGWQASYKAGSGEAGQSLELVSPDKAAFFSLKLEAIPAGGWEKMIEDLSVRPQPDHGPPNMQADASFVVTFNDTAAGMTGRKIYQRLDDRRYLIQTALGFHADLPGLINTVEIAEGAW